nr:MAG TPA: hypothetical protein [Caudoviricetes sp.]
MCIFKQKRCKNTEMLSLGVHNFTHKSHIRLIGSS